MAGRQRGADAGAGGGSAATGASRGGSVGGAAAGAAASELLRVDDLSRFFGGFAAVADLSFHVEDGEILGLVGPNGAGKTTTFNVVTGFLKPSAGRVHFRGEDVTGLAPHVLAKKGMVRTFQHTRVFASLSVRENVRVASHMQQSGGPLRVLFGAPGREEEALRAHVDDVLATVGLTERQHDLAGGLAYGEQRVLEIALALAAKPTLLMLDEPFAGMNETESSHTMDLIHAIRARGITVLVIDHHMQTMAKGCDRLVVMDHGVKLAEGAPGPVTSNPDVIDAYLGAGEDVPPPTTTPSDGDDVLTFDGVSVSYGRVRALDGLDLRVGRGEIVALVGANGAGKTTALRAVSGLVPLRGGSIRLLGRDLAAMSPAARVKDGLAHCPEGREIFPRMSVLENLELGAGSGARVNPALLERVYALFPRLRERSGQQAGSLSGGEQQMLAIGRALMSAPKVLLLDEPSLGLAPLLAREVAEALSRLNEEGMSILLVEQNAVLALAVAHRAYVLENGRVALEGAAAALRQDEAVKRVYLGA